MDFKEIVSLKKCVVKESKIANLYCFENLVVIFLDTIINLS